MTLEEQLVQLKKKRDSLNVQRIETATRLKALEEEKTSLLSKCTELGVDPQELEQTVKEEEQALQAELAKHNVEIERVYAELRKF